MDAVGHALRSPQAKQAAHLAGADVMAAASTAATRRAVKVASGAVVGAVGLTAVSAAISAARNGEQA